VSGLFFEPAETQDRADLRLDGAGHRLRELPNHIEIRNFIQAWKRGKSAALPVMSAS
jgi:hypothetical protein